MFVGTQFTGTVPANQARRWFTFNWPAAWQVDWNVMSTSPQPGAAQIEWDVAVERATADRITYWITIRNVTGQDVNIEARYAVLN
ncbi:hypothetical protein [Nonomuraea sp. NPDC002799]